MHNSVLATTEHGASARSHHLPEVIDQALVGAGMKGKPGAMAFITLTSRLTALARLHRDRGVDSLTEAPAVRRLLASMRASYTRTERSWERRTPSWRTCCSNCCHVRRLTHGGARSRLFRQGRMQASDAARLLGE